VLESEGKAVRPAAWSAPECTDLAPCGTVEGTRDVEDRGDVRTVVAVAQLRRKTGLHGPRSLAGPLVSASTMDVLWPSLRMTSSALPSGTGLQQRIASRHFVIELDGKTACQPAVHSFSRRDSGLVIERTAERYFSAGPRSSDAGSGPGAAHDAPGRPLTALTSVLKFAAGLGCEKTEDLLRIRSVTVRPSACTWHSTSRRRRTSSAVAGLVAPRRNAATSGSERLRRWQISLDPEPVAGRKIRHLGDGRVCCPRVTVTRGSVLPRVERRWPAARAAMVASNASSARRSN